MEFDLSSIEMSKSDIKRGVRIPKQLDENLAEFLGVMVGDGHLGYNPDKKRRFIRREINISGNKTEKEHLDHIQYLFEELFGARFKYLENSLSKEATLRYQSKGILEFLNKICSIPSRKKTDIVGIPEIIKESGLITKCKFLRGLADTDYSFCFKNRTNKGHNYPVIRGCFRSKILINDLEQIYREIGFVYCVLYNESKTDKRFGPILMHNIYLNGKKNFEKWVNLIGSSHQKNLDKTEKWQKDGVCPPGYKKASEGSCTPGLQMTCKATSLAH